MFPALLTSGAWFWKLVINSLRGQGREVQEERTVCATNRELKLRVFRTSQIVKWKKLTGHKVARVVCGKIMKSLLY